MRIVIDPEQDDAQQRRAREIERDTSFRRRLPKSRRHSRISGQVRQILNRQIDRQILVDHLKDFTVLFEEAHAKRVVPAHQGPKAIAQRVDIELALDQQSAWQIVGRLVRSGLLEQPEHALGR